MTVSELKEKLEELPEGEEVLIWNRETRETLEVEDLVELFDPPTRRVVLVFKTRTD